MASCCLPGRDDLRRSWKGLVLKGQKEKKKERSGSGWKESAHFIVSSWPSTEARPFFDAVMVGNCSVYMFSRASVSSA